MVAGLKFLSKKGFNPQNLTNQKRVWEAQKVKEEDAKKAAERERQLQRERDDDELARSRGETPRLGFLYAVPPGMQSKASTSSTSEHHPLPEEEEDRKPAPAAAAAATVVNGVALERQPGDDDAAAAFRQMLASSGYDETETQQQQQQHASIYEGKFGTVLQGTTFDPMTANADKQQQSQQSALEKAVGRRHDNDKHGLSLQDQIQRFPSLANAPRAKGMTATDIGVSFKPLGTQIRNVRCLACGIWGHSKGDRECQKSGWDPFAATGVDSQRTTIGRAAAVPTIATATKNSTIPAKDLDDRDRDEHRRRKKDKRQRNRLDREESSSDDSSGDSSSNSKSSDARRHRRRRHKKKHKKQHHRRSYHDDDSVDGSDSTLDDSRGRHRHRRHRHKKSHKSHKRSKRDL